MLVIAMVLCVLGCRSTKDPSFAPLDAEFELVPGGGARYLVLTNSGGHDLHNLKLSIHIWNNVNSDMMRDYTHHIFGSVASLAPQETMRVQRLGSNLELPILERVTRIEVVGKCDEGFFRQTWDQTGSNYLQPVGANAALILRRRPTL